MLKSLQARCVIVTGASKGIGRGIALCFGAAGSHVVVASRNAGEARAVAQEIIAAGGTAIALAADVTRQSDMQSLARTALEAFGAIHVLCANAGIMPSATLEAMSEADFDAVMATNLKGALLAVQACLPAMKAANFGRIILTSSITGPITGYPGWSHYGASKAAQLGFMRTAALELAGHNITVNAILPGNILTEGLSALGEDYVRKMQACVPLGRLGSVSDIGHAAAFLASDEAGFITGHSLVVDGGQILPEAPLAG